ncbi:MAG: hypothetical protein WD690_15000 [Vicinamibacterales bacterium]
MKELPRNPPVNPEAEREHQQPRKEPDLERAIDDETGGLIRPGHEELRSDKHPDEKPAKPHHH